MADVWCSGFASLPRGDRSFSSTMIQALALARPVITSPSPEKARYLHDGETVFFVPLDNPSALAEVIRYCRLHPNVASRVGQAGRRLAQQMFDLAGFDELLEHLTQTWFDR
jgi:glycosyltransferase involved in cell wall biosynthesis